MIKNLTVRFLTVIFVVACISLFICACKKNTEDAGGDLAFDRTEATLQQGDSITLTLTGGGEGVTWHTGNSEVAEVDVGKVTAVGAGRAFIYAKKGELTASCHVTVTVNANSTDIMVRLSDNRLSMITGEQVKLTAVAEINGAPAQGVTFEWSSSNEATANVDTEGNIEAAAAGETVIAVKAEHEGIWASAECLVKVTQAVGISLSYENEVLKGDNVSLNYSVLKDGGLVDNPVMEWSVSNNGIATVNNGILTAHKGGRVTVTAAYGGVEKSLTLDIVDLVRTAAELMAISAHDEGIQIRLEADITVSQSDITATDSGFYAVNELKGELDGRGHKITFSFDDTSVTNKKVGVFGKITASGKVVNTRFDIYTSIKHDANQYGALVQENYGVIADCYIKADIYTNNGISNGVKPGIAGLNKGLIKGCVVDMATYIISAGQQVGREVVLAMSSRENAADTNDGKIEDVVVISRSARGTYSSDFVVGFRIRFTAEANITRTANFENVRAYQSRANFLNGNGNYITPGDTNTSHTFTPIETGTDILDGFSGVWSKAGGVVTLCGEAIF